MDLKSFTIRFTARVVFRDSAGTVLRVFEVGDTTTATHDNGHYFMTTWGGIYHDEAERV